MTSKLLPPDFASSSANVKKKKKEKKSRYFYPERSKLRNTEEQKQFKRILTK